MSETSISLFPEFLDPDYPQSVENESRNDLADTIRSTLDPVFRDIRKAPDLAEEQADWTGHEGDYLSLIDRARMALGTMAASCWYGMLDENNPYIRKDVGILRGVLQAAAAHKDGLIRYLDRQVEAYDKQSRLPVTRGKSAAELGKRRRRVPPSFFYACVRRFVRTKEAAESAQRRNKKYETNGFCWFQRLFCRLSANRHAKTRKSADFCLPRPGTGEFRRKSVFLFHYSAKEIFCAIIRIPISAALSRSGLPVSGILKEKQKSTQLEQGGMMDTLGTRLAALLAEKGMTQTRLADKAGCTRIAVSYYVKDLRTPRPAALIRIARTLGTTTDYLLYGMSEGKDADMSRIRELISRNRARMTKADRLAIIEMLVD